MMTPAVFGQTSTLVYEGVGGQLEYGLYANRGQTNVVNKVPDFSTCGYKGGGVKLPYVPAVRVLTPVAGDNRSAIQAAINQVAAMPLQSNGFRGAILLKKGNYNVSSPLTITKSGIVLRGEGQGEDGTILTFTATVQSDLLQITGGTTRSTVLGTTSRITDSYVPSGTHTLTVASAASYQVGNQVIVKRTTNTDWINWLGMGSYGWINTDYMDQHPRIITAINGNTLTLHAPIVQAIQNEYGGGEVFKYTQSPVENVGVEGMRLKSTYVSISDEAHGWNAIRMSGAKNCWVRQVTSRYFGYSCVSVGSNSTQITVEDSACLDPKSQTTGGRKYSFNLGGGTFVLFQRCYTRGGRHDYVTGARVSGPNAFVDCVATQTHADSGPHHRYAVGTLFDNIKAGSLNVENRQDSGSGHGWSGAQQVFWNAEAAVICETPNGAQNMAIGVVGTRRNGTWTNSPDGIWQSHNTHVTPRSLYYTQLRDRLGMQAVSNVTISAQQSGTIWTALIDWAGNGRMPGVADIAPFTVNAGADRLLAPGDAVPLQGVVSIDQAGLTVTSEWSLVSGPAAAIIADPSEADTTVSLTTPGEYRFRLTAWSGDITYHDEVVLKVAIRAREKSLFHPDDFESLGVINSETPSLTFNTDTLEVSPGFVGRGVPSITTSDTEVAVFTFDSIDMTKAPTVVGSRAFALLSKSDFTLAAGISANGGSGGHGTNGVGTVGGHDGGDSPRTDLPPVNPNNGQGPGGSMGKGGSSDTSSSGGGGYGGRGGAGNLAGGETYGTAALDDLLGGSGAGGTVHKGGGAGGGAIELAAAGRLVITATGGVSVRGGGGSSSGTQLTSGGGSGGSILLWASEVVVQGSLNASGGNGGDASGGQPNGGGGGGGRIAIYYKTSLDVSGGTITVAGGVPSGSSIIGKPGNVGTIVMVSDSPIADDQSVATRLDTPIDITLTASDSMDNPLTYSVVGQPANGTLSGTPPNLTYTPQPGFTGEDSFTFKVNNGDVDSNVAMISIGVLPVPSVNAGPDQTVALTGTVPAPWTPAIISPKSWYDPSDVSSITIDTANGETGDQVSNLADKSGNGKDVFRATGTTQPTTGVRTIGGLNVIDFDGGDSLVNNTVSIDCTDVSVFVVRQWDSISTSGDKSFNLYDSLSSSTKQMNEESTGSSLKVGMDTDLQTVSVGTSLSAGILSYIKTGTNSQQAWLNGTSKGTNTNAASVFSANLLYYGSQINGAVGEMIVIESALTDSDRQKIEGYLAHKWGLTASLPADHPYKSAAPTQGGDSAIVNLTGSTSDAEGDSLTITWSVISAPAEATVTFADPSAVSTTANFDQLGTYVLRLTASDSLSTVYDEVIITVTEGSSGLDSFNEWAASGGDGITFNGDSNSDGVADGMSWLLGADGPTNAATELLPQSAEDNGDLTLIFKMLNATQRGSAVIYVQYSSDLGITDSWYNNSIQVPDASGTVNGVEFVITPINGTDHNQVQAIIPASAAGEGGKIFARLQGMLEP